MSDFDTLDRLRIAYAELCGEAEMVRYQRDGLSGLIEATDAALAKEDKP